MKVKFNNLSNLAAFLVIAAMLCSFGAVAFAADDEGCSVASLRGSYGIQNTGSIVSFGPVGPLMCAHIEMK